MRRYKSSRFLTTFFADSRVSGGGKGTVGIPGPEGGIVELFAIGLYLIERQAITNFRTAGFTVN